MCDTVSILNNGNPQRNAHMDIHHDTKEVKCKMLNRKERHYGSNGEYVRQRT